MPLTPSLWFAILPVAREIDELNQPEGVVMIVELKWVKGKSYDKQDKLLFLVLKNCTILFGQALTLNKLWFNHAGTAPLPELRGAGHVNERTARIEFVESAFGREIYPDRMVNIAASQASLAEQIAGLALQMAVASAKQATRGRPEILIHRL